MITKDLIEKRLAEIEKAATQLIANFNVLEGAKGELQTLLKMLEAKEDAPQ